MKKQEGQKTQEEIREDEEGLVGEQASSSQEDTQPDEKYDPPPRNQSLYELLIKDFRMIQNADEEELKKLSLEELAKITLQHADKIYKESRKASPMQNLEKFYPEKILLLAAKDPSELMRIHEIFRGNIYLQRRLWRKAKKLYHPAMQKVEKAKKIFSKYSFVLIPQIYLAEIIKKYGSQEGFNKLFEDLSKQGYPISDITQNKAIYQEALQKKQKSEDLLASSDLNLILTPLHIAELIKTHGLVRADDKLKASGNSFKMLSQMDVKFATSCLEVEDLAFNLPLRTVLSMVQICKRSETYRKALKEKEVAPSAYLSTVINKLETGEQSTQLPEVLRELKQNINPQCEKGKYLRELLAIETENLLELCQDLDGAKTLFYRQYLPFNLEQAVSVLKLHYTDEIFFAAFSVWLEKSVWLGKNNSLLPSDDLLDKNPIVQAALANRALAVKILIGQIGVLIGEKARDCLEKQYPDIQEEINSVSSWADRSTYYRLGATSKGMCKTKDELTTAEAMLAQAGKFDYLAQNIEAPLTFGIVECLNKRKTQEDRVAKGPVTDFVELNKREQEQAILATFDQLQMSCGQYHMVGTCALLLLFTPIEMVMAHLADSFTFSVKIMGTKIVTEHLNSSLHTPNNPEEVKRVNAFLGTGEKMPESFFDFHGDGTCIRLKQSDGNGGYNDAVNLSVTRALGGKGYRASGLIHQPDIYRFTLEDLRKGTDRSFIVLACDGLIERSETFDWIGDIVSKNLDKTEDLIALALLNKAIANGSKDNISIVVIDISLGSFGLLNHTMGFAVFDGHGGADVSTGVSRMFFPILNTSIQAQLQQRVVHTTRTGKKDKTRRELETEEVSEEGKENKLSKEKEHINQEEKLNQEEKHINKKQRTGSRLQRTFSQIWELPSSSSVEKDEQQEGELSLTPT